jgi:hypothetical protein
MEVSANQMKDPKQLAQYFSFIFGGMRVIELTLKFFISKYLIREHGVFISLTSLIFALAFVILVGLTSFFTGYLSLILIVASLGKVFERSFYISIYAPTINLLYQAYPQSKRSLTQNYADGYGKTIGQLIAALFIFGFAKISNFEGRILILLVVVLAILIIWFFISKKLINHYKLELTKILNTLKSKTEFKSSEEGLTKIEHAEKEPITTNSKSDLEFADYLQKMLEGEEWNEQKTGRLHSFNGEEKGKEVDRLTAGFIEKIKNYTTYQLIKSSYLVNDLIKNRESKALELIQLFINIRLILTNDGFSFHHSQNRLKKSNFLYSGVIQNYSRSQKSILELQDYYFLLEERMFKYTYLLNSLKEVQHHSKPLELLLQQEISSTKLEILFCLSLRHDANTLDQIVTMINKGTKSEELLALELLELMLDEQEKKWVLAIFKETNFDRILSRLQQDFPQISLGIEDRLISMISTKKLDLPDLIEKEALQSLLHDHQNSKNQVLIHVLNANTYQLEENDKTNGLMESEIDDAKSQNLEAELTEQLKANPQFSLSFFYWKNLLQNDQPARNLSDFNQAIKLLYKEVFPMEKLNS